MSKLYAHVEIIDAAVLFKASIARRGHWGGVDGPEAEFKDDSLKADAFNGCIYWEIFAYVDHMIDTNFPCRDATKAHDKVGRLRGCPQ
jgi:hypothetical protein